MRKLIYSNVIEGKRRVTSNLIVCPVCGLSLRSGEVEEHYKKELSSVDDLSDPTSKR